MGAIPYFRLYPGDWLASGALLRLTVEQEGVLLRLLLHAWNAADLKLPADPTMLANACKVFGPERWAVIGQPVLEGCFRRVGDSYVPLADPLDLAGQRADAEERRAQAAEAGRHSRDARRSKHGTAQPSGRRTSVPQESNEAANGSSSDRSGLPEPTSTSTSTSSITSSRTKRAPRPRGAGAPREGWLTPYGNAWTEALGGTPPWGELAATFKAPQAEVGPEELLKRWTRYLEETEPRFVSPTKFAQRHGAFKTAGEEDGPSVMERERDRLLALAAEGKL